MASISTPQRPITDRALGDQPLPARLPIDRASEEWSNYLTHGVGTLLSLAGAVYLLGRFNSGEDRALVAGCVVYTATLVAVYACSTLSHFFAEPRLRRAFRVLDQAFIYLLIVGSYTPVAITYLHGGGLTVLFWGMWSIAAVGFLSKTLLRHRIDGISTVAYVVLGWMPILAARSALALIPLSALVPFFLGGLCYTIGVVFLLRDTRVRYFHTVWHLFVMAGSALHFYAVVLCVDAVR
jgi:hemolysin III